MIDIEKCQLKGEFKTVQKSTVKKQKTNKDHENKERMWQDYIRKETCSCST